jgi:hypothetical protein
MGVANILLGFIIIMAVVVGSVFSVNYYSNQTVTTDTYGNAPSVSNNATALAVVNGSATGTQAEGGLVIFVAVLFVFGIIAYYAFGRR